MKLVDTSAWVHQIRRRGDARIRARVEALLESGDAAWCPLVRLELWNGVGSDLDRRILREYEATLPELPITDQVWRAAYRLADRCRAGGRNAGSNDILIAACARVHGVGMEYADSDFDRILALQDP